MIYKKVGNLKLQKSKLAAQLLLYAVTDRCWLHTGQTLAQQVEQALQGGITMLQLREKQMSEEDFLTEAQEIKKLTDAYQVPLIINDNLTVACQSNAAGLHIGQDDGSIAAARQTLGKGKILGVSARTIEQAQAAQAAGADYLGVGAVFGSNTKNDAKNISLDTLKGICQSVKIPVVAIGGITEDKLPTLLHTGIAGVAVISAVFAQPNISNACQRLFKILND